MESLEKGAFQAASLVAYCNAREVADLPDELLAYARLRAEKEHPAPYNVRYWQLGNETRFSGIPFQKEGKTDLLEKYHDNFFALAIRLYKPWTIREIKPRDGQTVSLPLQTVECG